MNNLAPAADPGIGHNIGTEEQSLRENLLERFRYIEDRNKDLIKMADTLPETVDANTEKQVGDYLKSLKLQLSTINTTRLAENEEYRRKVNVVNGLFKSIWAEPLEAVRDRVTKKMQAWLEKKAEAERLRQEAAARLERERRERERVAAEEKRRREEEEAERLRKEAAERQRQHEEEMARKRAEIEAAEKKRQEERAKLEAEQAAERQRIAAAQEEAEENKRKAARLRREAEEAEARNKREAERLEREGKAERERLEREAERLKRQQEKDREEIERQQARQDRAIAKADNEVGRAEKREDAAIAKEEKVENMTSADLSRTRGGYGSLTSLKDHWTFANLDRATIDLEPLRQHIPTDALDQAVRSFIKAGGRALKGVDIFQDTSIQSR